MTMNGVLMSLGGIALAAIIVKGFWLAGSIKPSDKRNKWETRERFPL